MTSAPRPLPPGNPRRMDRGWMRRHIAWMASRQPLSFRQRRTLNRMLASLRGRKR